MFGMGVGQKLAGQKLTGNVLFWTKGHRRQFFDFNIPSSAELGHLSQDELQIYIGGETDKRQQQTHVQTRTD